MLIKKTGREARLCICDRSGLLLSTGPNLGLAARSFVETIEDAVKAHTCQSINESY